MKISYQGIPGSYSEGAIIKLFGKDIIRIDKKTFNDVFLSIINDEVNYSLIPIENSLGGCIHINYDLLLKYKNIKILGEFNYKIEHNLLVLSGIKLDNIDKVISHYQALAQCDNFLKKNNLKSEIFYDTAGSAKYISDNKLKNVASIASKYASNNYGLEILEKNIEDNENNYTRFLLIGKSDKNKLKESICKTSIVFTLNDNPGILHKTLTVFSMRNIDLTKIESRPNKNLNNDNKFNYLFYLDFICDINSDKYKNALNHLKELTSHLRILGNYNFIEEDFVKKLENKDKLKLGIIGFGRFGQFLGKELNKNFNVIATSRKDYTEISKKMNIKFEKNLDDFFKNNLQYLLISTSILSFEKIVKIISNYNLKNILIIDVCSVKEYPLKILKKYLPNDCDILCTHPMFGPDSGKYSWENLPFIYDKIGITNHKNCDEFINFFKEKKCKIIEISCNEHDKYSANCQFITHLTGRILSKMNLKSTPINTKGFENLLKLIENTEKDSYELFKGLYKYNENSYIILKNFKKEFHKLYKKIFNKNNKKYSENVLKIEKSKTTKILDIILEKKRNNEKIISLCVGQPNFKSYTNIKYNAIYAIINNKIKYTNNQGIYELREKISKYLKIKKNVEYAPEQIICTNGAKNAIYQSLLCICNPNDEVIISKPYWTSYPSMVKLINAKSIIIETKFENNFCLTEEELENNITENTKAIILCNPNNPTGYSLNKKELEIYVKILKKYPNIYIISDEIYEGLTHNKNHICISLFEEIKERVILINGFSKTYNMCGYRLGYIASNKEIIKNINKIQSTIISCPNSISQYTALSAFDESIYNWIDNNIKELIEKKKYIIKELEKNNIKFLKPNAAFYFFIKLNNNIKSEEFCKKLLDEYNIACTPGSAFGLNNYIRICYSINFNNLKISIKKIINFIKNNM